jgi:pimeloyl-ACP methyl ester carboxylesterase
MWSLLVREDGQLRLPAIIRYMEERVRFRGRWIGALGRLDIPTLIAWGELDPVAKLAIGERLASETPGADLVTWKDLGHYPQVEEPARVASTVYDFVARVEDVTARRP